MFPNSCLNNNHPVANSMSQIHLDLHYTPITFIENVPLGAKDYFGTKLKKKKKILGRILPKKFFLCRIRFCPYSL